jgi:hypothetical protein
MIEQIVAEAYKLYMPQDEYEITELARFVSEQMRHRIEDVSMGRGEMEVPIPFKVVEIGTKFGGTFYIWNKLVEEHGDGVCVSVDMSDGGIHGGIPDEEMDKRDLWFTERFKDCHFIRGDSHDRKTAEKVLDIIVPHWGNIGGVDNNEEWIDFLFIDGDHTYEGVRKDFDMYSPFVKKGGIIAFHDINDTQRHRDRDVYVGKFWNEVTDLKLPKHETSCVYGGVVYDFVEFNSNLDWAGIGVLVKK